jgi:hypothetical protein
VSSSPPPSTGSPIVPPPIEPGRAPGGCARGGLIGCGAAAILVLILMALLLAYVRRKPEALTDLMMGQIERNLASDVTVEEKEKLRTAYAAFRARLQEHRVSGEALERLRSVLSDAARGPVGREQVRELTRVFESATATIAPAGVSAPVFSPTP